MTNIVEKNDEKKTPPYMFYLNNSMISEFIEIKDTTEPITSASYLDCYLCIDNGKLITRLYDKRDDFNFPIVNFPFLSRNIPSAPAYGEYVSQLVHNALPVANIKTVLIEGSCSPVNCCHKAITEQSLYQQVKSSLGDVMILLMPTMWPFLNLFLS